MGGKKVGSTLKVRKRGPKVVSLREAQSTKRDWVVVGFLVVGCSICGHYYTKKRPQIRNGKENTTAPEL
jgi:hypothetical protein